MKKIQDFVSERVTTDAVHRRLYKKKNSGQSKPESEQNGNSESDYFYCVQCNKEIDASNGKEDLKLHFQNVEHVQYSSCVYCSKPVYEYKFNKKQEFYHMCKQD